MTKPPIEELVEITGGEDGYNCRKLKDFKKYYTHKDLEDYMDKLMGIKENE